MTTIRMTASVATTTATYLGGTVYSLPDAQAAAWIAAGIAEAYSGGGGGAVDSVNGQTGAVVLAAADVGAEPAASLATDVAALNVYAAKCNLTAVSRPTDHDDATAGYIAGSLWYDPSFGVLWMLYDPTEANAIWKPIATTVLYDTAMNAFIDGTAHQIIAADGATTAIDVTGNFNNGAYLSFDSGGNALFSFGISAANISGTNTGDQDLSGYAVLSSYSFGSFTPYPAQSLLESSTGTAVNLSYATLSGYGSAYLSVPASGLTDGTYLVTATGDGSVSGTNTGDQDLTTPINTAIAAITPASIGAVANNGDVMTGSLQFGNTTYHDIYITDESAANSIKPNARILSNADNGAVIDWSMGGQNVNAGISFDAARNAYMFGAVQLAVPYTSVSSPVEGMMAWDYTYHVMKIYNGTTWQTVATV